MNKQTQRVTAIVVAVSSYLAMIGAAVWGMLKGARPSTDAALRSQRVERDLLPFDPAHSLPAPGQDATLESLSTSTPGDATLDHLARTAVYEQRHEALITPTGFLAHPREVQPDGPPQAWNYDDASVSNLLADQSLQSPRLAQWSIPQPPRLPVPTFAPAVMAFGIVMFAMGLATVWYVCVVGAVIFAAAGWRWTGELQGE